MRTPLTVAVVVWCVALAGDPILVAAWVTAAALLAIGAQAAWRRWVEDT